jgi:spore photoproduct lyase
MPDKYSQILEPNTTPVDLRIKAIDRFIKAGYDVHINFSPVIVTEGWLVEYPELFRQVNGSVENKDKVKAEVIFLTHNVGKHNYNLAHKIPGEELLWRPDLQEDKVSEYGGENIRYIAYLKAKYIKAWTKQHDQIIPWNTIRYIF